MLLLRFRGSAPAGLGPHRHPVFSHGVLWNHMLHAADFGVLYRFRHPHPCANVHPPSALHDFFARPEQ